MTLEGSATQAAAIGTEHSLLTRTSAKSFVLAVDTNAMQDGDLLELRIYTTVLTGGASRVAYKDSFQGAQDVDDKIKISVPVPSDVECHFTLKQVAGVGRSFP